MDKKESATAKEDQWKKLEIPIFSGEDAIGWVNKAESYFQWKEVTEEEKLKAVKEAMKGKALSWFQWCESCIEKPSWEMFSQGVVRRFQPSMVPNPYELLLRLRQTTTVEAYRAKFDLYAGPMKKIDPVYLQGVFLEGLKEEIKAELKLHSSRNLTELMNTAQRIDEKDSEKAQGQSLNEDRKEEEKHLSVSTISRTAEEEPLKKKEKPIKKKEESVPVAETKMKEEKKLQLEEEIPGETALQTSEAMHVVTTVEQQLLRQQSPLDKEEKAEVEDELFKGVGLEEKHLWKDGEVWLSADPAKSQPLLQAQTPPPPPPPPLPHLTWSPPLLPFLIKQPPRQKPWESGSLVAKQPPPPPKPPDGNPQAAAGGTWTAKPPWACNGVPCLISEVDRWPRHMSAEEEAKARMAVLPCQASEEEKRKARMAERGMCIKDSALNLIDQTHIGLAETVEAQPMSHLRQNRKVKWVVNRGAEYLERYFLLIACAAYLGSKAFAGFCGQGESKTTLKNWLHQRPALQPQVNWVHLFEIMHEIAMKTAEESVRVEAVSIMNLVLLRSNAYNERGAGDIDASTDVLVDDSLLNDKARQPLSSKGRQGHINYRDSKLTRILQPSLGGNARSAIICTLSPARSHVEQTRNTLLFAACAKEVTTKAQVNVVMSDKALVKQLQTDLARLENELRTPGPATTNCDYAATLRKKDLQIEKMEKEIRELIKQRDLAQSRVEDLLRMVGNDQKSRKESEDIWEDDDSVSESSSIYGPDHSDVCIREFNNPHYNDEDSGSNPYEYTDEYCKEVQCVELEESSRDDFEYPGPSISDNGVLVLPLSGEENAISQEVLAPVNEERVERQIQDSSTYGVLEQRLNDVQLSTNSRVCSYPDKQCPQATSAQLSNFRNLKLIRSWSCREHHMTGSPERTGEMERTPANGYEKGFPGRLDALQTKFLPLTCGASTRLLTNGSPSSIGSPSLDELRSNSMRTSANEDITSIQTFVAGMKEMVKLGYEKQLLDGQDQQTARKPVCVKDIGVDPILEAPGTPLEWPLQFKRLQKEIVQLWQTCSISLVHRTYFFLLFGGDPTDSIYVEVELRRLSFLKETFPNGSQSLKDGQIITLTTSAKALRREREMLEKLMLKRLSEEERKGIFKKWGIDLDSKRRRMQLANRLWSDTEMNHVTESAAIVAKLVRFSEQGKALKEMFGLSFTPQRTLAQRSSYSWRNRRASIF